MNSVALIGRLTRDAEVRYTQGEQQTAIARFTLAVDRRVARNANGQQQTADFISCVAFGKRAEFLEKYGRQGVKFAIEGRIQTGSYTNRDGQKVYTTDVAVENIEFCESKANQSTQAGKPQDPPTGPVDDDGFMHIPDDVDDGGLPFS